MFLKFLGEFGYNCHFGNCYAIPIEDGEREWSTVLHESIAMPISCGIILVSYGRVWAYMRKNHKFIKTYGTR